MYLQNYYSDHQGGTRISRAQASKFAKHIAGDFNPIHDETASRFCVPGDLLFALVLDRFGLNTNMKFTFAGMVGDGVQLQFPDAETGREFTVRDEHGKELLRVERSGEHTDRAEFINRLSQAYVEFSGQTFPHILVPLMASHEVMIHPERPLVMYESMLIELQNLDAHTPRLELSGSSLEVNGKRGTASIAFDIIDNGEVIGHGRKNLLLSGLRPYVQDDIDQLIDRYADRKQAYQD